MKETQKKAIHFLINPDFVFMLLVLLVLILNWFFILQWVKMTMLLISLLSLTKEILLKKQWNLPSKKDEKLFDASYDCHIWEKKLWRQLQRVQGKRSLSFYRALRGAAHNSCNVNNKNQKWHQFYVTIFQIMESGDASLISSGLLDLFLMIIYLNTTQWRLKRFQSTLK